METSPELRIVKFLKMRLRNDVEIVALILDANKDRACEIECQSYTLVAADACLVRRSVSALDPVVSGIP